MRSQLTVRFVRVTLGAVAVELISPLRHVATAPVLGDQLGDAVDAFALASRTLDAQNDELARDIAKGEVGAHPSSTLP